MKAPKQQPQIEQLIFSLFPIPFDMIF